MTSYVQSAVRNGIGHLVLDRPKALNSLSLDMVRSLTGLLLSWRDDPQVRAVVIRGSSERAFCAGGDIRFFYEAGRSAPTGGSALLEDFFTEEYALNHLIHRYPKPYVALMDGVVMGGGMGIAQAGSQCRLRIVTERTKMAMPEVNIGLFPDVGGSHFLTRTPGQIGAYLALTGRVIGAADALFADLADVCLPSSALPSLLNLAESGALAADPQATVRKLAGQPEQTMSVASYLAEHMESIDRHFAKDTVAEIMASLRGDASTFAHETLELMALRSPLMMCVTLAQLQRGASLDIASCLRMERNMVRRCFEHGEVVEGVRALAIDKDNAPRWNPPSLDQVTEEMVAGFFVPPWPEHAHPLQNLD